MHDIKSMPYGIGPLYIPEYVKTRPAMQTWLAGRIGASRSVYEDDGVTLKAFKNSDSKIVFFVHSIDRDGPRLDYVMELNKVQISPKSSADLPVEISRRLNYQSSVWRGLPFRDKHRGFPAKMFWKYLVSSTRTVVSDSMQSDAGEAFWYDRISDALRLHHKVFTLDCEESGGSLLINSAEPFTDLDDFKKFYSYEQDMSGHYKRFAITL